MTVTVLNTCQWGNQVRASLTLVLLLVLLLYILNQREGLSALCRITGVYSAYGMNQCLPISRREGLATENPKTNFKIRIQFRMCWPPTVNKTVELVSTSSFDLVLRTAITARFTI